MFTGIIEDLGMVTAVHKTRAGLKLAIDFLNPVRALKLGESIAVDGVCLTAAEVRSRGFSADVVRETLKATTLGRVVRGQRVHLERALKVGARLGGHYLTGHVDGRGKILRVKAEGRSKVLWLKVPAAVQSFILPKGSIAVNGVSLTVQEVKGGRVKMALVPHTLQETLLGSLKQNSAVNIEADALVRKPKGQETVSFRKETAAEIKRRIALFIRQGF